MVSPTMVEGLGFEVWLRKANSGGSLEYSGVSRGTHDSLTSKIQDPRSREGA